MINVEIKTINEVNTRMFKIKEYKKYKYDLIILIASRNKDIIRLIEDF